MKNLFLSIVALFATTSISAQTVTNLNDSGPGSLRGEILAASPGDVISLSPSLLANGSDTLTLQSDVIINKGLTIQGINTATDTLYINGGKHTRLFYVDITGGSNQHLKLKNLTLINGRDTVSTSDGRGGALLVLNADSVTIEDCHFEGNENNNGGDGGACYIEGAHLNVMGTTFLRNRIVSGQNNCYGGAICVRGGSLHVEDCNFIEQSSSSDGAGISVGNAPFVCVDSYFDGNINNAGFTNNGRGGAIHKFGERALIKNCVFAENITTGRGSALYLSNIYADSLGFDSIVSCYFLSNHVSGVNGFSSAVFTSRTVFVGCTFQSNTCHPTQGGGPALSCFNCDVIGSTFSDHASGFQGIIRLSGYSRFQNVTITENSGEEGVVSNRSFQYQSGDTLELSGTVIAGNLQDDGVHDLYIKSQGYNVLYNSPSSAQPTDIVGVTSGLNMEPLAMNGGLYPTHIPMVNSPAYNAGDSTDFSPAQNGPIFGRRDIGAAERGVISYDTTLVCGNITWWGNNYNMPGTYSDTAYNANSIDSVGVLVLYSQDTSIENRNATLVALEQSQGTSYQWVDCANGYSPIAGATDSTFLPTANGSYAVVLTNGSCSDTSDCINYNEVGIKEQSTTPLLTFYPNPTSGSLTLYSPNELPNQLQVLDLSGRTISTIKVSNNEIQLPALTVGIYLLKWEFEGGVVQVDRVVVE